MKLPFVTRSIIPGLPFVEFNSLIIAPLVVSTSTRWLTATSVTKALLVTSEMTAQQVAFWSAILVDAETVAILAAERESVALPKDASVTKMLFELGIRAVPNRTAVPAGEDWMSCVETWPLTTGKTERKPVLLTVGLPFTVVMSAVESALKKVWETVFSGPIGGVICPRLKGRRAVSRGFRPFAVIEKHAIPALAPLLATQAC